jgi:phosphatidate cytidylyltransferase
MILPRVLTALLAAPFFLWLVWLGALPFAVFFLALIGLGLWEFHRMAEQGGYASQGFWGIGTGFLATATLVLPGLRPDIAFPAQGPGFALVLVAFLSLLREFLRGDKSLSLLRVAVTLSSVLLVAWPLGHVILLRDLRGVDGVPFTLGRDALFLLLAVIWVQDTAAWAGGMALGRHRLAPAISPKKSVEGGAIGLGAAVLAAVLLRELLFRDSFGRGEAAALAAVLGVAAQFSDLAESLWKRAFGVKDSSQLLPGHGGVLDRFDSFLFSAPLLYFYLVSLGKGR